MNTAFCVSTKSWFSEPETIYDVDAERQSTFQTDRIRTKSNQLGFPSLEDSDPVMTPIVSFLLAIVFATNPGGSSVPVVDAISPRSGPIGSEVVISGAGFGANAGENRVSFGGVTATVVSASETRLVVTVPSGAQFSPITVSSNGLIARSSDRFNITFDASEPFDVSYLGEVFVSPYFGSPVETLAVGDLDGDGVHEIVTVQGTYGDVHIHTASYDEAGLISFVRSATLSLGVGVYADADELALGDLNGDGRLDIVASEYGSVTDNFESHTCIFINRGSSSTFDFDPPIILSGDGYEGYIQLHDINGDGRLDLVTSRTSWHQMGVYLNTTEDDDVSFAPKVILDAYIDIRPAFADLNGDGLLDVVSSGYNRNVHVYLNTSSGDVLSLELVMTLLAGGVEDPMYTYNWSTGTPRLADIDGDGMLDIITRGGVYGGSPNGLSVMRNTSTESQMSFEYEFEDYYEYDPTDAAPIRVEISDLDGDGKSDIVTTDWRTGLSIWMNASSPGTIALQDQRVIAAGDFPYPLVLCDLNQDATPEFVVGNYDVEGMRIIHNFIPLDDCQLAADFDGNDTVDGSDLGSLLGGWGRVTAKGENALYDLNADGFIGGADVGLLLADWGDCS